MNPDIDMVGTTSVSEKDKLNEEILLQWMTENVAGFSGPMTLSKFKGGQSNPTYCIETPNADYVLRRKPFGKLLPSAHAVDREHKVIAALHPTGFPVAKPFGLCTDDDVIGTMFYVMERAKGRNLWNGTLPNMQPAERTAIYNAMIDTLAALHKIKVDEIGLSDYGKPDDYCARQIARWSKQYKLSETETIDEMDNLINWLPTSIPAQHYSSITHGDFRLDNMIFDANDARVIAVLDWELSTLGDPIADFTYFLMSWIMPPDGRSGIAGLNLAELGIPNMEETISRYKAQTGFEHVGDINWYLSYNLFRIAAILQGIVKRVADGTANSPQAAEMGKKMKPLTHIAWGFAQKAGA
ncbi:phosphotransferase family protein [Sphingorhabdus lutea]|uniref:Phosphotransferase family protein n=1 Tax=Sphingorhabdus lutea TaxID=1913578 RepID=A0A1L3JEP5_9SPHN|nr:phosphotransferase family protein [Sphingorhabdus lutea]APG63594.1 phosphotransferase family protein [Sphingorhabdus lutea]